MKLWLRSLALHAAVWNEAFLVICQHDIKERENVWKMEWFVRYTCVLNQKPRTENFRYEYVYRYLYIPIRQLQFKIGYIFLFVN